MMRGQKNIKRSKHVGVFLMFQFKQPCNTKTGDFLVN